MFTKGLASRRRRSGSEVAATPEGRHVAPGAQEDENAEGWGTEMGGVSGGRGRDRRVRGWMGGREEWEGGREGSMRK